jgi:xylose isomerase
MVFDRATAVQQELGYPVSLQAHYPNEIGPQNASKWAQMIEQTGIGVDSIVPFLFGDKIYQHGSLTNYNRDVREHARQRQLETFQTAALFGIPTVNHWLGIDGFENPMGQKVKWMFDQIMGATADAMNEVPGQQATLEPKPYEPRAHNIMALTHDGLLVARGIEDRLTGANRSYLDQGIRMVGMTPEIGHMKMGFEVLGKSFEQVLSEGRLFCIHWNGQPDGNYDVDGNPGLCSFETLDHIAYVLQRAEYQGVNTLDINPLRMKLASAAMIGFMNLGAAFDAAKAADHRLIEKAVTNPERDGNAILELYQLAQRRPGTVWAEKAMERVRRMAEGLQVSDLS